MRLALAALGLTAACASAPRRGGGPGPDERLARGWHYTVSVDPALRTMRTTLCVQGAPPARLVRMAGASPVRVRSATDLRRPGSVLAVRDGAIVLAGAGRDVCVRYELDLLPPVVEFGRLAAETGEAITVTSAWLWRPEHWVAGARVTARFELPEGVSVSTPWPRAPASPELFVLDQSALQWEGYVAFGRFAVTPVQVPGGVLEVARLRGRAPPARVDVERWLQTTASLAASLYDGFPTERAQILLLPMRHGGGIPVPFGLTSRGGGDSVLFLLDTDASEGALLRDWVAVHEFVHLGHPVIDGTDAWLAEGLATYYQEVLRARAGLTTPQEAWQQLHAGFERGRRSASRRTLHEECASRSQPRSYTRVYWSGAAIAFLADVRLRAASGGRLSLDAAMAQMRACCLRQARSWTAVELLSELDRLAGGGPVLAPLARRYADSPRFPELGPAYAALGLRGDGDALRFDDRAELARVRDAIMRAR